MIFLVYRNVYALMEGGISTITRTVLVFVWSSQYVRNGSIWGWNHFSKNINLYCDVDWSSQNLAVVPKFRMIGNASESFHHPQVSLPDDEREERGGKEMGNLPLFWFSSYLLQSPRSQYSEFICTRREVFSREFQISPKFNLTNEFVYGKVPSPPQFLYSFPFHKLYIVSHIVHIDFPNVLKTSSESFAINYCSSCKIRSFLV